MCLTLRHNADTWEACFIVIPWNIAGMMCARASRGNVCNIRGQMAMSSPEEMEEMEPLEAACLWPPVWLWPIPSSHGNDTFLGGRGTHRT